MSTNGSQVHVRRLHTHAWRIALVGLGVALLSALLVGGARSASEDAGLIAFTRDDAVYVMRPDGSDVRLLWRGRAGPTDLAWSPDGSKLAVSTWGRSIWVVSADGTDPVRVARVDASSLSWSADGRRIAFTRYVAGDSDIWLMNADGSNMRRLKRTPELFERDVDWSPMRGRIAFISGGFVPVVYVMRTNGRNLRELLPPPTLRGWPDSTNPDWSPDGRRIVFASVVGSDSFEIWVMNASGKQWVQLTKNRVHDSSPVWSPDGRRIAFVRGHGAGPNGSWEIYVMNADGTGATRLTYNRVRDGSPAWAASSGR